MRYTFSLLVTMLLALGGAWLVETRLVPVAHPRAEGAVAAPFPWSTITVAGAQFTGNVTPLAAATDFMTADTQLSTSLSAIQADVVDPTFLSVAGSVMPDGTYTYPLQAHVADRYTRLVTIAFGYDPVRHRELVAAGIPTAAYEQSIPASITGGKDVQGNVPAASCPEAVGHNQPVTPSCVGGGGGGGSFGSWNLKIVITDPLNAQLAWNSSSIMCGYTFSALTSCYGSAADWWFSNDGWVDAGLSDKVSFLSSTHAKGVATDLFVNVAFCLLNATYVHIWSNEVDMFDDGSGYGNESVGLSGGCTGLLTISTQLWST